MGTLFVPRGVLLPAGKWTVDEVDLLQSLVASYRQALEQQEAADGPRTISSSMLPSGATEARPAFRVRAGQRAHICSMHSDGMSVQLQLSIVWQLGVLGRMRAGRAAAADCVALDHLKQLEHCNIAYVACNVLAIRGQWPLAPTSAAATAASPPPLLLPVAGQHWLDLCGPPDGHTHPKTGARQDNHNHANCNSTVNSLSRAHAAYRMAHSSCPLAPDPSDRV